MVLQRLCTCPAVLLILCGSACLAAAQDNLQKKIAGPWDLPALKKPPEAVWGRTQGLTREVWYSSVPFQGKPTRVFAYYARPASGEGPFPAMVLVHGGGGKAFAEWATLWAQRGYVALAMDLAGNGPDGKRLADGGPGQDDQSKFRDFTDDDVSDMWTYHAVAAVLRGHSLLADQKEVDSRRIGLTGISWGGYLTCIAAGLDDRFKVAVPVYGCGFLHENSVWLQRFARMSEEQRERWISRFDPSNYLPGVKCPILFVNGTNDFAYPLDSYQKSYRLVPGRRHLCIKVGMPHGHPQGWSVPEIAAYAESILSKDGAWPELGMPRVAGNGIVATVSPRLAVRKAELHYTMDTGPWQARKWKSMAAMVADGRIVAQLPEGRPAACFFTIEDDKGLVTSSEHLVLDRPGN